LNQSFDAIVVGAGMVGASAALMLAQKGFSVAVLERQSLGDSGWQADAEFDLRVSAISPASQQLLSRLGVWAQVKKQRHCDYHHMCVWHEHGDASMNFSAEQTGSSHLGTIVENELVQAVMIEQLRRLNNISLFDGFMVDSILQSDHAVSVLTKEGQRLDARLLIAADGRESTVRKLTQVPAIGGTYEQTAIVANVTTELAHENTAWQRFLSTGPLAFLPLSNGQSSIVWSADSAMAEELLQLPDAEFMQQLSEAIQFRLGAVTAVSKRAGFPLAWHLTERWLHERVLFIGDAAHGVHPLAGQGVNLGFEDVALLASFFQQGMELYDHRLLRRFERQRKAEVATAMHLFSALKLFYAQENPLLCWCRDIGMSVVEKNQPLKRQVIRSATRNMA
jgi:ubiquinone biosynthesis UbiH/UbiF/VisC/COQ6 family hydroxylase